MRELVARIRAVLRRASQAAATSNLLRAGEIVLDMESYVVTVADVVVDLTPTEFELLAILMSAPGYVFSRTALLERLVQATGYTGLERTINVHIRNLRTKIENDPSEPTYIETVFGVGYRFSVL